jgi:hypothetical protein
MRCQVAGETTVLHAPEELCSIRQVAQGIRLKCSVTSVTPISRERAATNHEADFSKGTAALSDSPPALFRNRAIANSCSSLQRELAYSGFRNKGGNRNYPRRLFRNKAPYSGLRSGVGRALISIPVGFRVYYRAGINFTLGSNSGTRRLIRYQAM